jgi:acyl-CoA reductase-like NAD-dependent aldehyde dehydrogenase
MTIASGRAVAEPPGFSTGVLTVINPATETVLAEVPCATRSDFDVAVQRARQAYPAWRAVEPARRQALKRCAELLRHRRHALELATLLTREQGKPKREALNEVFAAGHWFASLAELPLSRSRFNTPRGVATIECEPVGLVGAITSWNYPIFLAACKIAAAILPGNVVIVKPSPYTPLATLRLAELLTGQGAAPGSPPLPDGVLTVLLGDRAPAEWLLASPDVGHVSFTGSTGAGQALLERSADTLTSTTLELGGNDAAIVLADVDVEQIAESLFWGAFTNAGQFCTGIKRLYVQASVLDQVVGQLAELARQTIVGDGLDPRTQLGPLAHQQQFARVVRLVDETAAGGATLVTGGAPLDGPGYFYPATLVTNVDEGDRIVDEEQFGPVLPILAFTDIDEAVERANATRFGLGASLWTGDRELAADVARRLDCGTVWINQHGTLDPLLPFGGRKHSGLGYENGWAGVSQFTRLKTIYSTFSTSLRAGG